MKKVNVLNFKDFLSNLKLNKFDKEIRAAIITNSMIANKIVKDFNETVEGARARYTEDLDSEIETLVSLRNKYQSASVEEKSDIEREIIENCTGALTAEKELNDFINNMLNENVTESFIKINKDNFVDQCVEADIEITVNMLDQLSGLFS